MKRYKNCALLCTQGQTAMDLLSLVKEVCENTQYKVFCKKTWHDNDTLEILAEKPGMTSSMILMIAKEEEKKVEVVNILPSKKSSKYRLEIEEYNSILNQFRDDVFVQMPNNKIEENKENYTIEDLIPKTSEKLKSWLRAFPLSGHPSDEKRWYDFLISLKNNGENLCISDLSKYIEENYNWSAEDLQSVLVKYEEQIDLLDYYDEHRSCK